MKRLLGLTLALAWASAAPAQSPAAPPATAPASGATVGQAATPVPRQPRSFQVCTREAVARRYRGAERRHFVSRCQLGYGRRLFRPRTTPAAPPRP